MQLLPLSPEQVRLVLRAMKTVALANESFSDEERALLEAVADALNVPVDMQALEPASIDEIARAFQSEDERRHVIQMLIFTAVIDGDASPAELVVIRSFADELGIEEDFIKDVRRLAVSHLNVLRLDIIRRLPLRGDDEPDAREDEGWIGLWKVFGAASRTGANEEIAWRHKELGLLPDGALGRAYFEHMTERKLLFPGERGAILPAQGNHDFMHVLTGYDTDPNGEIELGAFTAGMMKLEDPFGVIFGTICMAHLGDRLTSDPSSPPRRIEIDAERIGAAFRRGLVATVDFNHGWDYWADVRSTVEELQRRYAIFLG